MCDCEEIQGEWEVKFGDMTDDGIVVDLQKKDGEELIESISTETGAGYMGGKDDCVWLPRQDQIQKMILNLPFTQGRALKPLCEMIDEFTLFALEKICHEETLESMEKIWLEFYMWEKHKKRWSGERWISG